MPRFYKKVLHKRLEQTLEDLLNDTSPSEQLQLYEELALMRTVADEAVGQYSAAVQARDENLDPTKAAALQELVMTTGMIMRDHLNEVVRICEAAARIEQNAKDKISIHQLHFFVQQVVKCAYDAFDGQVTLAQLFDEKLRTNVRLPAPGQDGTDLLPSMDVQAMDLTIPRAPQPTAAELDR